MSSHSTHRIAAQDGHSTENAKLEIVREADLEALLREVRSALRATPIRNFHPQHRRKTAALVWQIDAYLDRFVPTPLGLATAAAAHQSAASPTMIVDREDGHVVATCAGVWIGVRQLVDWDLILPLLPSFANSSYAAPIAALPDKERVVFLLHRMGGLSLHDIARKLDCDTSDCERLLGQAIATIAGTIDRSDR